MMNCISLKRLHLYIILLFIGITVVPFLFNPCTAQNKTTGETYKTIIQQADLALSEKDYAGALLLYEKAKQAKPEYYYASDKIEEINIILEAIPDTKAQLFEDIILKAENYFSVKDYPKAKTEYQKAILIDPSAQFPKDRLSEISSVYTDPDDVANFNIAIANGDKAFSIADFDKAVMFYEAALEVHPNAKFVKEKIVVAKKQQSDNNARIEQSVKSIASADKLLQAGKRMEARTEYSKALELTPDNEHAKEKITDIDNYLSDLKAVQDNYDKSIELADQFYINRDFANARVKYQEALKAKPEARYPKEMLEKTKSGESQLQSDQQRYDAALASAENFLKSSDYEAAIIGFKSALALKPSENYPKTKIAEIEKLVSETNSRKEAFEIAVKNGDQSFIEKKYDVALGHFRNSLSLLPGEKYPLQKIAEITAITENQIETEENYKKSLAEADKQLRQNKFEDAIATYTKALKFKPDETYPQQKIAEAQAKIESSKNQKESYAKAIANADRLFSEFKYNEALEAYDLAHSIDKFSEYPISKMSEINFLYSKYTKAIEKGDKALAAGNTELAIKSFQDALIIKPTDQPTQEKITEIKTAAESQQKTDAKFATVLKTADQLFAEKDYSHALETYTEASGLKTNEKYPKDQIAKITKIVEDLRSVNENYTQAITEGDNNFDNQKLNEAVASYNKALAIKPAEAYPKSQVEKIIGIIAAQTKLDAEYLLVIASADKLFASKNYESAVIDFRKALALKPSEKYPSDQIAEAEKQIEGIKITLESYNKAIADGDKFFSEKDYLSSMAFFKRAIGVKPDEDYPNQKITEIQAIFDKDKAEGEHYQEAIALADKLFADKKYSEAIEPYQRASKIKPTEKYPQNQVVEINKQIASAQKLEEEYQKTITDAESLLKEVKYDEARDLFSVAANLKPSDKLPKDKIAEIDGMLAAIKLKDQNYSKAISDGDASFSGKRYLEATQAYTTASALKPDETYPKIQLEKIINLVAEQQKLDNNFLAIVTTADQFFDSKNYAEALVDYRKALLLKPEEKYPSEKIAEAEKLIASLKTQQEAYNTAIADGNKKLADKEYENALSAYKNAISAKPAEAYPNQKIAEIQSILDQQKIENASYAEAIKLADKFFADQKYREALEPYQRASTIKTNEKYPQDQISRINTLLAEQKNQDDDYQKLITDADLQFKAGKYDEARTLFTNAGTVKPLEKLPKDKISEIDAVLTALKVKDENYSKAIAVASDLYSAQKLEAAIKLYEEAQALKPSEKFPQERISAIKTELKAIDENYSKALALGDSKLLTKNLMEALNAFQNALEIKPGEEYPKTKIAEINASLSIQKEEKEKMYQSYIAEGDRLFAAKEYGVANSAFAKATGIKPDESYPKQRIIEINKIVEEIELARKAEYGKALGEADRLYNTKVFDQAIDAYEIAAKINPDDPYPALQINKIRKYMSDHAIQDLSSQTLVISEGNEKKFAFSAIEPRLRKNNYILLKARSTGKSVPKVYLNYGKDNQKNGGIVLRSLDKTVISDYLIRISVQDKWYREDNNWISLSVETGDIEITKVVIAAGD